MDVGTGCKDDLRRHPEAMSLYRTKDAGEIIALRLCGIPEPEPGHVHTDHRDRELYVCTFEASEKQDTISRAFAAQFDKAGLDSTELFDEEIAAVACEFSKLRREFFHELKLAMPRNSS